MRLALAAAITAWTLIAWGGRVGLLAGDEGLWASVRIGGSLLVGLFAAATLLLPALQRARRAALLVFSLFTVVLWARSLIVNWVGDGSLPFKLVHMILAAGFFALAWWSFRYASSLGGSPESDRAHVDSAAV